MADTSSRIDAVEVLQAVRLWVVESTYSRRRFTIEERAVALDATISAMQEAPTLRSQITELKDYVARLEAEYAYLNRRYTEEGWTGV